MRPLTDTCPKPLLRVRGKPLLQWPMEALAASGFSQQLVNTAWLGEQIEQYFSSVLGLQPNKIEHKQLLNKEQIQLRYSHEGQDFGYALETAGGICRALPQLADVFWVLAGDVFAPTLRLAAPRMTSLPSPTSWPISGWCPTRRTTRAATLA